ncbi:MAG: hypothetical protein ACP5I8_15390, partial [Phycisphaerae bacterium]
YMTTRQVLKKNSLEQGVLLGQAPSGNSEGVPIFSNHVDRSPKQFLEDKQPHSDADRVACLAYYLAHYRGIPHFKTVDISKLNTEAAQFKFSNAAVAVNNAALHGLLTSAGKGNKQISAVGERFVEALPDRESAKKVLQKIRIRRARGKARAVNANGHAGGVEGQ